MYTSVLCYRVKKLFGIKFEMYKIFFLVLVIHCVSCKNQNGNDKIGKTVLTGEVEVWCDESLKKIIEQEEDVFESAYQYAKVNVRYDSEKNIMNKFFKDSINVIIVTHALDSNELKYFKSRDYYPRQYKFGKSAIAFIGNKDRKNLNISYNQMLEMLSSEQNQIFAIENKDSGIGKELLEYTKTKELGKNVYALQDKTSILTWLEKNTDGIGIIDWCEISDSDDPASKDFLSKVSLIGITPKESSNEFVKPYQYNLNGLYPFTRDLYFIRKEALNDASLGFASFICEDRGQKILLKAGLLPEYQTERWVEFKGLKDVKVVE